MKTIILNASPRKNMNTASLLKEAAKGAHSSGQQVEYIDLYDIIFTGCHSCMACKRKNVSVQSKCYWTDEFSTILDRIYAADRLIIGSPIYYNQTTSQFHALMERLCFPAMSYNDYSSTYQGKLDIEVFLTMNVGAEYYAKYYAEKFKEEFRPFHYLNGITTIHPFFDTLQVNDYSKYNMAAWDEEHKREVHKTQFQLDLKKAFHIGVGNNKY